MGYGTAHEGNFSFVTRSFDQVAGVCGNGRQGRQFKSLTTIYPPVAAAITINMLLFLLISIASVQPVIQESNPKAGLSQAAMATAGVIRIPRIHGPDSTYRGGHLGHSRNDNLRHSPTNHNKHPTEE
jgi:Serine incorporator (Serinc)